jgi:hypothetical protein
MIVSNPPSRLVKHIIRSYARLAENTRVRTVMRENMPGIIKDKAFYQTLDDSSKRWLQKLIKLLGTNPVNPNPSTMMPNMNQMPGDMNFNNYNEAFDKQMYGNNFNQNFMNNYNGFIFKNGK